MQTDFTTGQFRKLLYHYKAGQDLIERKLFKEARLELNAGRKILEQTHIQTPLLARYYLLYRKLYAGLNDSSKADYYHNLALETARACHLDIEALEKGENLHWIDPLD